MKKVLRWTSLFLALALVVTGGAMAWDEGYHVKRASDNKGDLIIFPAFFTTADGWETKLTVTNTHPIYSVVAKVVYRSHYWTTELLDHLIYLSPRDVWTGIVRQQGGNVIIHSTDDSMLSASGVWADEVPVNQPFFTQNLCTNDSADRGYVEVLEVWYGDTRNYMNCGLVTAGLDATPPVVDKDVLLELYPPDGQPAPEVAGLLANCLDDADTIDHTINVMTGFFEIQNPNFAGMTSALEGLVFADFDLIRYLNVAEVSGLNSYAGQNTLGELEAAIAKDRIAMPYVNRTGEVAVHWFNFPTKLDTDCTYDAPLGPFWQNYLLPGVDQCLDYSFPFFDLKENQLTSDSLYSGGDSPTYSMCEELNWIFIMNSPYYEEGWVEYDFDDDYVFTPYEIGVEVDGVDDFSYEGFPVNPFVLYVKNVGVNMFYPAWDNGMVYGEDLTNGETPGSWLPNYQTFNVMDYLGLNNTAGNNNSGLATYPTTSNGAQVIPFAFPWAPGQLLNPPNRP